MARASQGEAIVNHEIAMSRLASARRLREARQAEFARWSADIAADEQRVAVRLPLLLVWMLVRRARGRAGAGDWVV